MLDFTLLTKYGIDENEITKYDVLCLPENVGVDGKENLLDASESSLLSKRLKKAGLKCANSYDLNLGASRYERRGAESWYGVVWVLQNVALPLCLNVIASVIYSRFTSQKSLVEEKVEKLEEGEVHITLRIAQGNSFTTINYSGDVDNLMKILGALSNEKLLEEKVEKDR